VLLWGCLLFDNHYDRTDTDLALGPLLTVAGETRRLTVRASTEVRTVAGRTVLQRIIEASRVSDVVHDDRVSLWSSSIATNREDCTEQERK
jgi:hypothetical protein